MQRAAFWGAIGVIGALCFGGLWGQAAWGAATPTQSPAVATTESEPASPPPPADVASPPATTPVSTTPESTAPTPQPTSAPEQPRLPEPSAAADAPDPSDIPPAEREGTRRDPILERQDTIIPAVNMGGFEMGFDGYLRVDYATFTPGRFFGIKSGSNDSNNPNVGVNDGFAIGDARLNMRATYRNNLYVRLSFDAARTVYNSSDDPVGDTTTGVKDAYLRYTFFKQMVLFAGRFKPPYDVESLTPLAGQYFVHSALESRGVMRHEGYSGDMPGFGPGRQIGLMLSSEALAEFDHIKLGYALAITNGNSGYKALNDNDLPAVWARFTAAWGASERKGRRADEEGPSTYGLRNASKFSGMAGLGGYYNEVTTGLSPNRFTDRIMGVGADIIMQVWWFHLRGQVLWNHLKHLDFDTAGNAQSLGGHIQVSVQIPGTNIYPGYRFAYYDPRFKSTGEFGNAQSDFDRVMHHTIGVRYVPENWPLVVLTNYTHSVEQGGRSIANDRFELACQVIF